MKPTPKALAIDDALTLIAGRSREYCIKAALCVTCGGNAIFAFGDELSVKEYTISGMCKACQDSVFEDPEDRGPGDGVLDDDWTLSDGVFEEDWDDV